MDFKKIANRANQIREQYKKLEIKKYGKEWSNSQITEGLVGDIGDLMKLTMVKAGVRECDDVDIKIAHELSDILWSVLVLSKNYNIDLEKEFLITMDELELKIKNKMQI